MNLEVLIACVEGAEAARLVEAFSKVVKRHTMRIQYCPIGDKFEQLFSSV